MGRGSILVGLVSGLTVTGLIFVIFCRSELNHQHPIKSGEEKMIEAKKQGVLVLTPIELEPTAEPEEIKTKYQEAKNKSEQTIVNENYFVIISEKIKKPVEEDDNFSIATSNVANTERALTMIPRIKNNLELGKACKLLRDNGIKIYVENEFKIGSSWVNVDINATDQKIIDFLNKNF